MLNCCIIYSPKQITQHVSKRFCFFMTCFCVFWLKIDKYLLEAFPNEPCHPGLLKWRLLLLYTWLYILNACSSVVYLCGARKTTTFTSSNIQDCGMSASLAFHSAYFSYTIEPLRTLNHPETKLGRVESVIIDLKGCYIYLVDKVHSDNVLHELL